jgi:hypothetical protein
MGNDYRDEATLNDLLRCCDDYVSLADPDLGTHGGQALTSFSMRVNSEQLAYQQFQRHEMSRSAALFGQTPSSAPLKVITDGWDVELLGCTLSQYVGIGFLVHTVAVNNHGHFSADLFEHESLAPVTAEIPVSVIRDVLNSHFIGDFAFFRRQRGPRVDSPYRRFSYNPLLGRPVVDGIGEDLLVPVPGLLVRKPGR